MSTDPENPLLSRARRVARVFQAFLTDRASRLRFGARQREAIVKKIRANEHPTGYRVDWIDASVRRLLVELRQARLEFDARYPYDAASVEDLRDIVRGVYTALDT